MVLVAGMEQVKALISAVERWTGLGVRETVDLASGRLAISYRNKIKGGRNADNTSLASLKDSTLKANVRNEGHQTKRSFYGNTPMSASGQTADSITSKLTSLNNWEISSDSRLGDQILASNSKSSHSGIPFGGDTPKVVRDPLQVSDNQMDFMEDQILQAITRVIG